MYESGDYGEGEEISGVNTAVKTSRKCSEKTRQSGFDQYCVKEFTSGQLTTGSDNRSLAGRCTISIRWEPYSIIINSQYNNEGGSFIGAFQLKRFDRTLFIINIRFILFIDLGEAAEKRLYRRDG